MHWHQLDHRQTMCISLQTDNHASTPLLSFLQAGCPSCHPTNSIKALKAADWDYYRNFINPWEWHCHGQNCTCWTIIRLLFINIIQTSTLSEPVCQWAICVLPPRIISVFPMVLRPNCFLLLDYVGNIIYDVYYIVWVVGSICITPVTKT